MARPLWPGTIAANVPAAISPPEDNHVHCRPVRHDRITAPCVFDGPINGASFLAWVQQALVPTLSAGDIVIGQPLLPQGAGVHEAIEAVGATPLYLPCR